MIAKTPQPPYYAVIFTSVKTETLEGYEETAHRMVELAQQQPGFLGEETAQSELGITISYWKNLEDIAHWKKNYEHVIAQEKGKKEWYKAYKTRIARVERDYEMPL